MVGKCTYKKKGKRNHFFPTHLVFVWRAALKAILVVALSILFVISHYYETISFYLKQDVKKTHDKSLHFLVLHMYWCRKKNYDLLNLFFSGKHLHEEFLFMKPRYILFRRMYWAVRNTITLLYSAMPIFIVVTWGKVKSTYSLPSNNLKIVQWIEKKFNEWKMLKIVQKAMDSSGQ